MSDWTIESVDLFRPNEMPYEPFFEELRQDVENRPEPGRLGIVVAKMLDGRKFMNMEWIPEKFIQDKGGEEQVREWLVEQAHPPEEK